MFKKKEQKNTEAPIQNGKVMNGVVVSDKMQDTIVVSITRYTKHPKYGKYQTKAKKYQAHDAGNTAKIGDKVTIAESKPLSKNKRFTLISINK